MLVRVLLVALGGALGTAGRLGVDLAMPAPGGFPLATFVVNVTGAFVLGIVMARMPQGSGIRIFLGTGVLGGFTTYSAFGVGALELWAAAPMIAAFYAFGSLLFGVLAAALGLRIGAGRGEKSAVPEPVRGSVHGGADS